MKELHSIVLQLRQAQQDPQAADDFIEQYLPFIRSETAKCTGHPPHETEDELSIAMFAFYEAMMAYRSDKGAFLPLAAVAIRNRLIDLNRRNLRHRTSLSLDAPQGEDDSRTLADTVADTDDALSSYHDRAATAQEIEEFSTSLAAFSLSLTEVAENCPQQERTLHACMAAVDYAKHQPQLLEQLLTTGKLPITQLAQGSGTPRKTLERHRKYLVAALLAYTNGFEIIRGHLQAVKRREALEA